MNAVDQAKGRLRSVPLRVKLVTAVLTLVALALLVISSLTTFFLRSYLVGQVDSQLRGASQTLGEVIPQLKTRQVTAMLPSRYVVVLAEPGGVTQPSYDPTSLQWRQLPSFPTDVAGFAAQEEPHTVTSRTAGSAGACTTRRCGATRTRCWPSASRSPTSTGR